MNSPSKPGAMLPDFGRPQPHQPVAGSTGKSLGQAGRNPGIEFRRIVLTIDDQVSLGGES